MFVLTSQGGFCEKRLDGRAHTWLILKLINYWVGKQNSCTEGFGLSHQEAEMLLEQNLFKPCDLSRRITLCGSQLWERYRAFTAEEGRLMYRKDRSISSDKNQNGEDGRRETKEGKRGGSRWRSVNFPLRNVLLRSIYFTGKWSYLT